MDVVPPGTVDPTPTLYNTTMYSMAGLLAVAALCNAAMHPVHARHHMGGRPEGGAAGVADPVVAAAHAPPAAAPTAQARKL